jgi:hypothetical protein
VSEPHPNRPPVQLLGRDDPPEDSLGVVGSNGAITSSTRRYPCRGTRWDGENPAD